MLLMANRVAQQHYIHVNKLKKPSSVNASGLPMHVEGTDKIILYANEVFTEVDPVVISDLRGNHHDRMRASSSTQDNTLQFSTSDHPLGECLILDER